MILGVYDFFLVCGMLCILLKHVAVFSKCMHKEEMKLCRVMNCLPKNRTAVCLHFFHLFLLRLSVDDRACELVNECTCEGNGVTLFTQVDALAP